MKFCRDCKYDLELLTSQTCPECGRPFDSNDSSTFASSLRRRIPWEAWASVACSVFYFVALYVDSQPSAMRGIDRWYDHGNKFAAFIILFAISVGLLLAAIRRRRWIVVGIGLIAVLVMVLQIVRWVQGFLPYWF